MAAPQPTGGAPTNAPAQGAPAAQASTGGDALDKGIEGVIQKTGYGAKVSKSNVEKISDGVRSLFKKATGKDVPIADKDYST